MIPLVWPLLLQGNCYSLVYQALHCITIYFYGKINTLVPLQMQNAWQQAATTCRVTACGNRIPCHEHDLLGRLRISKTCRVAFTALIYRLKEVTNLNVLLCFELQRIVHISSTRCRIECLHNAVRTYMRTILPCSLVSFLYGTVWRKTTKHDVILHLLHNRTLNLTTVCVNILVT